MSFSEWKYGILDDVAEIIMGQSPTGDTCNEIGDGTPLLNGPTEFGSFYPTPVQFTTDPKKFSQIGDLLFCVRGSTTGRMNWSNQKFAIGRGLAAFRHKKGYEYKHFLKAIINVNLPTLLAEATGSTFPNVSGQQLKNLKIFFPDFKTQQRIASILSSLDNAIELNQQINKTLEEIAQVLFKEMCLPKEELPKGWRVAKLEELGEFKNGINYSRDENGDTEYSIVNVRDVVENKFLLKGNLSKINIDKKKALPYSLEVDDIVIVRSASPGETAILFFPEENIIYSGFTIRFRIFDKRYFLYYFFVFQSMKKKLDNISNGTTLKNVNQEMLKAFEIIIPDENTILALNKVIAPIFENILNNEQENKTLSSLRDLLLPKLMKGEIEII